jgi:signal transduction histidine kinase
MMRLWPDTLAARILALLFGMTLLLVIISAIIMQDARIEIFDERNRIHLMDRVTTVARLLDNATQQQRPSIIEQVKDESDTISLTAQPLVTNPSMNPRTFKLIERLRHRLHIRNPASIRINHFHDMPTPMMRNGPNSPPPSAPGMLENKVLDISIRLRDGIWLNIQSKKLEPPPPWASKTLQLLALLFLLIFVSGLIIAKLMARPMAKLADAADKLGLGHAQQPLAETGPLEVRQTIRAFNRMQQRLHKHITDRALMLAAVSHDLRTPVTTLRLRAEYIEDSEMREKTLATLSEMEAILSATLSFSRDEAADEKARTTDLAALLQSLVDDHADLGGEVKYSGPDKMTFTCRPIALKRALNNLIDNALKYAGATIVTLIAQHDSVEIHIDDKGPGVPEQNLEELFTPFFRLETSRNRDTGGTGLGLAVARSIVLAHGGELKLENRKEGGLRASITLPK